MPDRAIPAELDRAFKTAWFAINFGSANDVKIAALLNEKELLEICNDN